MVSKAQPAVSAWKRALFTELFNQSGAAGYGLSAESFTTCLNEVVAKYLPAGAPEAEIRQFVKALKVAEMVLARGCGAGKQVACAEVFKRYRAPLSHAARATL